MAANPLIVLVLLAVIGGLLRLSRIRVEDGQIAVLRRIGRGNRVLGPGRHWMVPLLDRVAHRYATIGRSVELREHRIAADQGWQVDGRVYFQVVDGRQAAPELGHLEQTVTEELDRLLPEFLPEHRDEPSEQFNSALKRSLNDRLRVRGILVARTQIQAGA